VVTLAKAMSFFLFLHFFHSLHSLQLDIINKEAKKIEEENKKKVTYKIKETCIF
jgi:hypothetical protein